MYGKMCKTTAFIQLICVNEGGKKGKNTVSNGSTDISLICVSNIIPETFINTPFQRTVFYDCF